MTVWQQAVDALRLHERSNCTLRAACFSCAANVKACTAVAFRTFAMREGLRRAIAATPLHMSITEWPAWTAEVLTYMAVLGQGLRTPDPERTDRASCSRLAAVLLHKDALAAAVASEGTCA